MFDVSKGLCPSWRYQPAGRDSSWVVVGRSAYGSLVIFSSVVAEREQFDGALTPHPESIRFDRLWFHSFSFFSDDSASLRRCRWEQSLLPCRPPGSHPGLATDCFFNPSADFAAFQAWLPAPSGHGSHRGLPSAPGEFSLRAALPLECHQPTLQPPLCPTTRRANQDRCDRNFCTTPLGRWWSRCRGRLGRISRGSGFLSRWA